MDRGDVTAVREFPTTSDKDPRDFLSVYLDLPLQPAGAESR
jgi:hypothetical protein